MNTPIDTTDCRTLADLPGSIKELAATYRDQARELEALAASIPQMWAEAVGDGNCEPIPTAPVTLKLTETLEEAIQQGYVVYAHDRQGIVVIGPTLRQYADWCRTSSKPCISVLLPKRRTYPYTIFLNWNGAERNDQLQTMVNDAAFSYLDATCAVGIATLLYQASSLEEAVGILRKLIERNVEPD